MGLIHRETKTKRKSATQPVPPPWLSKGIGFKSDYGAQGRLLQIVPPPACLQNLQRKAWAMARRTTGRRLRRLADFWLASSSFKERTATSPWTNINNSSWLQLLNPAVLKQQETRTSKSCEGLSSGRTDRSFRDLSLKETWQCGVQHLQSRFKLAYICQSKALFPC